MSTSLRLKSAGAGVMGTLIRKENRAASSRLSPRKSPSVIVAPERETPGNERRRLGQPDTERLPEPQLV